MFEDDFNTDPLNPRWSVGSGIWAQPGGAGYLQCSSINGTIWSSYFPTYPLGGHRKILAKAYGFASGDVARIYPRYASSSNYTAAEIVFGTTGVDGILRVVNRVSGIDFYGWCYSDQLPISQWLNVEICQDVFESVTTLKIVDGSGNVLAYAPFESSGPAGEGNCGLGTGSQVTNYVRFDDYQEIRTRTAPDWMHCPPCPRMPWCAPDPVTERSAFYNGLAPEQWQVDISGVIADECPTTDCDRMNSTFIVDGACGSTLRIDEGANWCTGWLEYMPYFDVIVEVQNSGANGCKLIVTLREWAQNGALTFRDIAVFERTYPGNTRASDIVNHTMTRTSDDFYLCDGRSAACTISAIMP